MKKGESEEKEVGRNTKILKVLPFLPPRVIAEQGWTRPSLC
jgi:hypothetical protein